AEFDLEEANDLLMVDTAGFIFTFYNDPNDAITGDDPIDSSALYTGFEGEEIHVRIASDESCYSYATLTLNVVEAPEIDPLVHYEHCDEGNGRADFNLVGLIPGIQDGDTNLEVTFFLSQTEALAGDVADQIDLTQDYNSATRTIWVRVVEQGLTCAGAFPLELVVNPLPVLPTSVEMVACEDAAQDNTFDLTDAQLHTDIFADVVGDVSEYELYFFENENQAENADITVA